MARMTLLLLFVFFISVPLSAEAQNGRRGDQCSASTPCATGLSCDAAGICSEAVLPPDNDEAEPVGRCTTTDDCSEGLVCVAGQCQAYARTDTDSTATTTSGGASGGCTAAGSSCTINTPNDGTCVQNQESAGEFYCRARATAPQTTGFVPLAPIPNLTQGITADQAGLANFLNNLYKYLIGLSATLAVIMLIWGGLEYATQDVPGAKQNGKERMQQAILGLLLVLAPALVFSVINPAILNLSANIPPIDLRPLPQPQRAPEPTRCDAQNLTAEQREACVRAQSNPQLIPNETDQATIQQAGAAQANACVAKGGIVDLTAMLQRGSQCDALALRRMQSHGYTRCEVMTDGRMCFFERRQ